LRCRGVFPQIRIVGQQIRGNVDKARMAMNELGATRYATKANSTPKS
jgi:hypothetical protein